MTVDQNNRQDNYLIVSDVAEWLLNTITLKDTGNTAGSIGRQDTKSVHTYLVHSCYNCYRSLKFEPCTHEALACMRLDTCTYTHMEDANRVYA